MVVLLKQVYVQDTVNDERKSQRLFEFGRGRNYAGGEEEEGEYSPPPCFGRVLPAVFSLRSNSDNCRDFLLSSWK